MKALSDVLNLNMAYMPFEVRPLRYMICNSVYVHHESGAAWLGVLSPLPRFAVRQLSKRYSTRIGFRFWRVLNTTRLGIGGMMTSILCGSMRLFYSNWRNCSNVKSRGNSSFIVAMKRLSNHITTEYYLSSCIWKDYPLQWQCTNTLPAGVVSSLPPKGNTRFRSRVSSP
jgi:hypothetical protein